MDALTGTPTPTVAPRATLSWGAVLLLGTLSLMTLGVVIRLWPEWSRNPDLVHGFAAPLGFGLLLWESRQRGTARWLNTTAWTTGVVIAGAACGWVLFGLAGLLAASLGWTHAVVLFVLVGALAAFWLAGLVVLAHPLIRFLPFNWISVSAVSLWLLAAPLPSGTAMRLTLALQNGVTAAVFHSLHFLGIAARQHGNLIELTTTAVGIEEACSGIRSLISSVYAGIFFAAFLVKRPWRRFVVIALAPVIAVSMNYLRSLVLTLLANGGTDITGRWHDVTGYAILTSTAAILALVAVRLGKGDVSTEKIERSPSSSALPFPSAAILGYGLFSGATGALALFFIAQERPAASFPATVPVLTQYLPAAAEGWEVIADRDLHQFSGVLQTIHLIERAYIRPSTVGEPVQITVYVAYWPAGQTTVSRVAAHTPDACWPGSGWVPQQVGRSSDSRESELPSPRAEHRIFRTEAGVARHVWFWHIYNGHALDYRDPYSVSALVKIALQHGFQREGDQYFVRLSSNRDWSEIAPDPFVRSIVAHLTPLGL